MEIKINEVEGECSNCKFIEFHNLEGLKKIKQLRIIDGNKKPIVCYGLYSLVKLLQKDTDYLLLTAPNNHYFQIPLSDTDSEKIKKINKENQPWGDDFASKYKEILKQSSDLQKFKHSNANLWAIDKINQVYDQVYDIKSVKKDKKDLLNETISFVYGNNGGIINENEKNIIKKDIKFIQNAIVKNIKEAKTNKRPPYKILFIDDMADEGWSDILKKIYFGDGKNPGDSFEVLKPEKNEEKKDFIDKALKKIITANTLILDFRLFKDEENERDYKKLASYKVVDAIKNIIGKNGKHPYSYLKILFFTASNKLISYNKFVEKNNKIDHLPQALFIKESPEQVFTFDESVYNFQSLIRRLTDAVLKKQKQVIEKLGATSHNELFYEHCENLPKYLKPTPEITAYFRNYGNLDYVILDTNMFIDNDFMKIAWYCLQNFTREKLLITSFVKKELSRIVAEDKEKDNILKYLNVSFFNYILENWINDKGFSEDNEKVGEGYADRIFPFFIESIYEKDKTKKILLITSDWNKTSSPPGPGVQIEALNINNIKAVKPSFILKYSSTPAKSPVNQAKPKPLEKHSQQGYHINNILKNQEIEGYCLFSLKGLAAPFGAIKLSESVTLATISQGKKNEIFKTISIVQKVPGKGQSYCIFITVKP